MAISNCKRCDRIFSKVRRDICSECIAEEDKAFQSVRDFLRLHRDASMSVEFIISMIQDGRLILRDNPNFSYSCERCGKPTQTGRYCGHCTKELSSALSGAAAELRQKNASQQNGSNKGFYSR
jgi:predicted amidophosphoribosyltransferase